MKAPRFALVAMVAAGISFQARGCGDVGSVSADRLFSTAVSRALRG